MSKQELEIFPDVWITTWDKPAQPCFHLEFPTELGFGKALSMIGKSEKGFGTLGLTWYGCALWADSPGRNTDGYFERFERYVFRLNKCFSVRVQRMELDPKGFSQVR
ncbi:MAG: hypothetical protein Ct9H300mP19_19880 [Dehalococcoidia bacterium]|nr:MAG: hypothetical protein Ct9H300mP19_19880 [Dehalococcoidia bacterium]